MESEGTNVARKADGLPQEVIRAYENGKGQRRVTLLLNPDTAQELVLGFRRDGTGSFTPSDTTLAVVASLVMELGKFEN